jgi:hypothetical protein
LFDATRPIVLNGIEDIVTRPDLADRAIFFSLEPIPEEMRKPEKELWTAFEKDSPYILGALLDAVSLGLHRLPETSLEKLPRMADFALWATACEKVFWPSGTFQSAYTENLNDAVDNVIEADPVGSAVRTLMSQSPEWTGTATELLSALGDIAGDAVQKSKTWPATPKTLSGRLRRAATFLRKTGIDIDFSRKGQRRTRIITITVNSESDLNSSSIASASSADGHDKVYFNEIDVGGIQTQQSPTDAKSIPADGKVSATVRNNLLNHFGNDAKDARDVINPSQSVGWEERI